MRINNIIFTSDDNPKYLDFWPVVSEVCRKKLKICPILIHIGDRDTPFLEDRFGFVRHVKAVPGIGTDFQAQIIRLYAPKWSPFDIWLTSDIDMMLLQCDYFAEAVFTFDTKSVVLFGADAYARPVEPVDPPKATNHPGRYPMCYVAALGLTFEKLFAWDETFEKFADRLYHGDGFRWTGDEMYLGQQVDACDKDINVHRIKRGWQNGIADRRIDRVKWEYDEQRLRRGEYIDAHLPRPYSEHKVEIDRLKSIVLSS